MILHLFTCSNNKVSFFLLSDKLKQIKEKEKQNFLQKRQMLAARVSLNPQ